MLAKTISERPTLTGSTSETSRAMMPSSRRRRTRRWQGGGEMPTFSAEKVGISPPPCHRRVRRLREEGIIARDVSLVDPVKVGRSLIVFASITLERQREDLLENFERKMMRHPEVMQCYFVSGDADYLV